MDRQGLIGDCLVNQEDGSSWIGLEQVEEVSVEDVDGMQRQLGSTVYYCSRQSSSFQLLERDYLHQHKENIGARKSPTI